MKNKKIKLFYRYFIVPGPTLNPGKFIVNISFVFFKILN